MKGDICKGKSHSERASNSIHKIFPNLFFPLGLLVVSADTKKPSYD